MDVLFVQMYMGIALFELVVRLHIFGMVGLVGLV